MAQQGQVDEADRAALGRVLIAVRAEEEGARGFLAGFLEGLGQYLQGMLSDGAPVPASSPPG